ncbi:MAG: hypothetical protein IPK32_25515 [Verrucomicrobiaceae bacterium]|nr:hypothetical protein [Verrucomicrobiaceae bacterium]
MAEELPQFGALSISRRADGKPVVLQRSPDEMVFLAFDMRIRRLVELHILRSGEEMPEAEKTSALDRSRQASEVCMPSFMRVLEVGEDNGLVYYTAHLNDGEFVHHYIARRGPLSPPTAFALIFQMLEDLLQLRVRFPRLLEHLTLDQLLVGTLEDTFLQFRVIDYGLSKSESPRPTDAGRLVEEVCRLIFLLLTGVEYAGENPDRFPALTALPSSLRTTVRAALTSKENAPTSLEKLRDEVREAFSTLSSGPQGRNLRKHLVVIGPLQPLPQLQNLLLENVPVQTLFGSNFRVEDADQLRRYPFSIPALNAKTEQPVTVHMLPPTRLVDRTKYEAVPLQMWRFNPERHPNILRSLSLWETPDWTFLTEEREPGFPLSRLMAERVALNPGEVLVLMRQVRSGLEQAQECGVPRVDLHPSNILLRVGKHGPNKMRETDRLMQRRLDAWPPFAVKLRPHMTMRSLYEPQLLDMELPTNRSEEHEFDREYRHRSFIALAAYLLAGERHISGGLEFSEAVPDATAVLMREMYRATQIPGAAPSPTDFLEKFEQTLSGATGTDLATRLRGETVPIESMESVGAVSDFDEDIDPDQAESTDAPSLLHAQKHDFRPLHSTQRDGLPWVVWAAAAVILLALGAWMLLDRPITVDHAGQKVSDVTVPITTETGGGGPVAKQAAPVQPTASAPEKTVTQPPSTEPQPVIIRKALLPTAEELEKMRQGQVKQDMIGRETGQDTPKPVADLAR